MLRNSDYESSALLSDPAKYILLLAVFLWLFILLWQFFLLPALCTILFFRGRGAQVDTDIVAMIRGGKYILS